MKEPMFHYAKEGKCINRYLYGQVNIEFFTF